MKKSIIFFSATAAILLSSCYSNKETPVTFKTDEVQDAVNVKTKQVGARDVEQLVEFTANVQADVTNNIAPQSPARIRKIYTEVGRYVSKGDLLVELDDNSLAQKETSLAQQRLDFARTEELYKIGGVAKSTYENAKASLEISERQYENLVENTRLLAPSDGIVTARNYDAGDLYNGANPVLVVEKITPVKILLDVNEQYYKSVKVGMTISSISIDAYPGENFEGRVSIVYPTISNGNAVNGSYVSGLSIDSSGQINVTKGTLPAQGVLAENLVYGEVPSGTADGRNRQFVLANKVIDRTVRVYVNGVRQKEGLDYRVVAPSGDVTTSSILFNDGAYIPDAEDTLLVDYMKA